MINYKQHFPPMLKEAASSSQGVTPLFSEIVVLFLT